MPRAIKAKVAACLRLEIRFLLICSSSKIPELETVYPCSQSIDFCRIHISIYCEFDVGCHGCGPVACECSSASVE